MIELKNKLYVITDEKLLSRKVFLEKIREAIAAGAGIVQLREKFTLLRDRVDLGRELVCLTHKHRVKLVINDDPVLAQKIGADGVHLGKEDSSVEKARELLGDSAVIGVSCYGDLKRALEMERKGVSYVSFGAFFPSRTKPKESLVPLSILSEAKRILHVPVVAIGGIDAANAGRVLKSGADCLAVVSSIFGNTRTTQAVKTFKEVIKKEEKKNGKYFR